MAYLLIEDFKGGLDSRRSRSSSKAGTLYNLVNAHINRGGEIEKRKGFFPYATLPTAQTFGLAAANSNLYTFGSVSNPTIPAGIQYQQLVHPSALAMTAILDTEVFNGGIYAIAQYSDGSVYAFFGGTRITTWDAIVIQGGSNSAVAASFASMVNADTNFISSYLGSVVTVTEKTNNVAFTVVATPTGGGAGTPTMTVNTIQAGTGVVTEVLATGSFTVTGGTAGGGNSVSSVKVNGVEVLGSTVLWATSNNATASAIASQINTFAASTTPKYTCTAAGAVVTITAFTGSGATPNGFVVAVTPNGTVTIGSITNFSGGVTGHGAQPQITTITIGGTFDPSNTYQATFNVPSVPYAKSYFVSGQSLGIATIVKTFKSKMYGQAGSIQYFSSINDPTIWSTSTINGSGFISIANQDSGSETLTGMGVYLGHLAIFSRRTIQLWLMDADPTKNTLTQTLNNIGTYAPRSVINFGDLNLFFVSDVGIRSLIPRDASGNAVVSDVGTPIDTIIQLNNQSLTGLQLQNACSIIDPVDGRYWLAVGPYIYVYSLYPNSQVQAWSIYKPGFNIDWMVYSNNVIFVRAGDQIYAYGGSTGNAYDSCTVTVETPYMDAGKPGNNKAVKSIAGNFDNIWDIWIGADPFNPTAKDYTGQLQGPSFMGEGDVVESIGTHFSALMTCTQPGYARISNFAIYYEDQGGEI